MADGCLDVILRCESPHIFIFLLQQLQELKRFSVAFVHDQFHFVPPKVIWWI
jgi:hypothetical protein